MLTLVLGTARGFWRCCAPHATRRAQSRWPRPRAALPDGAGAVDARAHAPVNYHAYAACTRGGFFRDVRAIPAEMRPVLVLLRKDLKPALVAVKALKAEGRTVAISWKESGQHQVAQQLDSAANLSLFREICALADGALSSTPELVRLYISGGVNVSEFIPTPYPLDDTRWDFRVRSRSDRAFSSARASGMCRRGIMPRRCCARVCLVCR